MPWILCAGIDAEIACISVRGIATSTDCRNSHALMQVVVDTMIVSI